MKSNKKTMILEKAFELFRKNGYTDTKVEDITKKLGISKGSFYTYFKTKEELLCELLESIKKFEMEKYNVGKFHEEMTKFFKSFIKENILLRYESNREYDMEIISNFIILAINNYLIEKIVCKKEYTFSSREEFDGIVEDNQKLINEIVKFIDNALK